jgi:hypothetical protein
MRSRRVAGSGVVVVGGLGAVRLAGRRWQFASDGAVRSLRSHETVLPAPTPRKSSQVCRRPSGGTSVIRCEPGSASSPMQRITWESQFNLGHPGNNDWRPFVDEQHFVPGAARAGSPRYR